MNPADIVDLLPAATVVDFQNREPNIRFMITSEKFHHAAVETLRKHASRVSEYAVIPLINKRFKIELNLHNESDIRDVDRMFHRIVRITKNLKAA